MIVLSTLARYRVLHLVLGALVCLLCLLTPKLFVVVLFLAVTGFDVSPVIDAKTGITEFSHRTIASVAWFVGGLAVLVLWYLLRR